MGKGLLTAGIFGKSMVGRKNETRHTDSETRNSSIELGAGCAVVSSHPTGSLS